MWGMCVCVCLRKEGSEGVRVYTPYTRKLLKLFSATAGVLISKRKIHKSVPWQGLAIQAADAVGDIGSSLCNSASAHYV